MGRTATVFVLLLLAACFDASFKEGLLCGPGSACPPGLTCGGAIDAPIGGPDARPDAPGPDATPPQCDDDGDCTTFSDECNSGACNLTTGRCVKMAANDCSRDTDGDPCGVTDVGCRPGTFRSLCCLAADCTKACGSCS